MIIAVTKLNNKTTEQSLLALFSKYGKVNNCGF